MLSIFDVVKRKVVKLKNNKKKAKKKKDYLLIHFKKEEGKTGDFISFFLDHFFFFC